MKKTAQNISGIFSGDVARKCPTYNSSENTSTKKLNRFIFKSPAHLTDDISELILEEGQVSHTSKILNTHRKL